MKETIDDLDNWIPKRIDLYFDQINNGKKKYEYRLRTEYWRKRLTG